MSMIEILVGIAIGMIGVLIMFQTVSVWDARSRSSTSGSDAQVAGTLAMFALERDIRGAGLGFGTALTVDMGCTVQGQNAAHPLNFPLRPVDIIDGDGTGVPDQINTFYGSSAFFVSTQYFSASPTPTSKRAVRRGGFKEGDIVVVAGNEGVLPGSSQCRIVEVTDVSNPDGVTLTHAPGAYTDFYPQPSLPASSPRNSQFNTAAGDGGIFTSGRLYNLGPAPRRMLWTVNPVTATLNSADDIPGNPPVAVAEGVINMKAQFGIDGSDGTPPDGQITDAEWTKTAPNDWTQVRAVKIALLVRSRNFEKPAASAVDAAYLQASAPTWSGGAFVMTNVDGTADTNPVGSPNNWRYYRYRVYEKVIPLRNMVWGTSP